MLQTSASCQTAVMTLAPGKASGAEAEAHHASEQVLLLMSGTLQGEIGTDVLSMSAGDVVVIPCGITHRFVNAGGIPAVTFSVYAPPEYPPDAKG